MDVTMPRLSDTMQEGTISEWLKKVGDKIEKGDVLAEIQTDKAVMELESYETGTLEQIVVKAGDTVPIGTTVAVLGDGAGVAQTGGPVTPLVDTAYEGGTARPLPIDSTAEPKMSGTREQAANNGVATTSPNGSAHAVTTPGRAKASPLARNIAADLGVDISQITTGSGPNGRIMREDVETFARNALTPAPSPVATGEGSKIVPVPTTPSSASTPASAESGSRRDTSPTTATPLSDGQERVPFTPMQKTVATRLSESKATVPHFYVSEEIDMTDLVALRKSFNDGALEGAPKVSVNDMIVKAAALALEQHPDMNVAYRDNAFIKNSRINVGIAVDVPNGLIVPVVRDANTKGVRQIARETKALIEKARAGKLRPDDYTGGTFSISNLGGMGVEQFIAVINPPEAAILAIGSVRQKVVAWQGQMAIRERMIVTVSADHRVLYGANVARFLAALKSYLEAPMNLLG